MDAVVAREYADPSGAVVLAGDAAHAFPPAGGFGLNTGLQDAQGIAWRIARCIEHGAAREPSAAAVAKHSHSAAAVANQASNPLQSLASRHAALYGAERRSVALLIRDVAMRNYARTLAVAAALGADAAHMDAAAGVVGSVLPPALARSVLGAVKGLAMRSLLHADAIASRGAALAHALKQEPLRLNDPVHDLGYAYSGPGGAVRRGDFFHFFFFFFFFFFNFF
jgi:hypothetical protein